MKQISTIQKKRYDRKIEKLKSQLEVLNIQLAEAKEHGDARENSERDAVMQEIDVATAQLNDLQDYLISSEVIEDVSTNLITIGSLVEVKNLTYPDSPPRLFLLGDKGDTVIEGILNVASPLGIKVYGNPSGKYSVQTEDGTRIEYEVSKLIDENAYDKFQKMYPEEDELFNEIFK